MKQDALDPIVEDAQLEAAVQEQIADAQAVVGNAHSFVFFLSQVHRT